MLTQNNKAVMGITQKKKRTHAAIGQGDARAENGKSKQKSKDRVYNRQRKQSNWSSPKKRFSLGDFRQRCTRGRRRVNPKEKTRSVET